MSYFVHYQVMTLASLAKTVGFSEYRPIIIACTSLVALEMTWWIEHRHQGHVADLFKNGIGNLKQLRELILKQTTYNNKYKPSEDVSFPPQRPFARWGCGVYIYLEADTYLNTLKSHSHSLLKKLIVQPLNQIMPITCSHLMTTHSLRYSHLRVNCATWSSRIFIVSRM